MPSDSNSPAVSRDNIVELWRSTGKHGNYQQLPDFLTADLGIQVDIDPRWRGDRSRLDYLRARFDFRGLRVTDIGANTGFFSLEFAHRDGARVTAIEPDPANQRFLKAVAAHYGLRGLHVSGTPVTLATVGELPESDMVLLLNVLHHAGDDFDAEHVASEGELRDYMKRYLERLAGRTRRLIFQLGYNWRGNKATPILPVRRPFDMLAYMRDIFDAAGWSIDRVAVRFDVDDPRMVELDPRSEAPALSATASGLAEHPKVRAMLETGALYDLSEFYARPLFVCSPA